MEIVAHNGNTIGVEDSIISFAQFLRAKGKKLLWLAGFILLSLSSAAQVLPSAQVSKSGILIGEQIELKLTIEFPNKIEPEFPSIDSLPHFEILEVQLPLVTNVGAMRQVSRTWIITSFDSGRWVIPPFDIKLENKIYQTDSLQVMVGYPLEKAPEEFHDIKDIATVERIIPIMYWIVGGILLLGIIILVYWWIKRRNKKPILQRYQNLPPLEECEKLLDDLLAAELATKERYTRMTYILRIFLHRKLGWKSFGKTTYDLTDMISREKISREQFLLIAQTLQTCTLVKFAKYEPAALEYKDHIEIIRTTAKHLNQLSENNSTTQSEKSKI